MPTYHSATHGNSFVASSMVDGYLELVNGAPYTDVVGQPTSFGKTFQLGNRYSTTRRYFHAPLAVLGFIGGQRPRIDKLYFFFKSEPSAMVMRLELWDSRSMFWSYEPRSGSGALGLNGDWSAPRSTPGGSPSIQLTNVHQIRVNGVSPEVMSAINLSIIVEGSSNNYNGGGAASRITFISAGLDLVIN